MNTQRGAARVGDSHSCPHGGHEGGEICVGSRDVWIDGRPAARTGDLARCKGPSDRIEAGAPGVFVNWKALARAGDRTRHEGAVKVGSSGVLVGDLGVPGDPRETLGTERIESDFALRRLRGVAKKLSREDFARWAGRVFGYDLPPETYRRLHAALLAGTFPNVEIVVDEAFGHHAGYDQLTGKIRVSREFARDATREQGPSWLLLFALFEEFGHHVDRELRSHFSSPSEVAPDAPLDEGAAFAFALVDFRFATRDRLRYGTWHRRDCGPLALEVSWKELRDAGAELDREAMVLDDGRDGSVELFDPKEHHALESALSAPEFHRGREVPFTSHEADKVYFGNWLSDWSQLVSPTTLTYLPKVFNHIKNQAVEIVRRAAAVFGLPLPTGAGDMSAQAARDILTAVAGVLACDEFTTVYATEMGRPWTFGAPMPVDFEVSRTSLGVYEPRHHLDNPLLEADNRSLDPEFRRGYEQRDGEIDPLTWAKRFFQDSFAYVGEMLEEAADAGRTNRGFIHLGRALHVIEDFYAHTNFVEIVLAKEVNPEVRTWSHKMTAAEGDPSYSPLVTGTFGGMDMAVSLLAKVLRKLDPGETTERAQPTSGDRIAQAVLQDLQLHAFQDHRWLARALAVQQGAYRFRSKVAPTLDATLDPVKTIVGGQFLSRKAIRVAVRSGLTLLLRKLIEELRARQIAHKDHEGQKGTDPTHSMIAKDMHTHPLQPIALECARHAVADVGYTIRQTWDYERAHGPGDRSALIASATDYLAHPFRGGSRRSSRVTAQVDRVLEWAKPWRGVPGKDNPITRATQVPEPHEHLDHLGEEMEKKIGEHLRQLDAEVWHPAKEVVSELQDADPVKDATEEYFAWMRQIEQGLREFFFPSKR